MVDFSVCKILLVLAAPLNPLEEDASLALLAM